MAEFTKSQLAHVRAFLAQVRDRAIVEDEERVEHRLCVSRVGNWDAFDLSDIDILTALWWFQFRHKPNSREWRPVIILRALVNASQRDYVEPGKLEVDESLIQATPRQKKQARTLFIRRFGFETYRRKLRPILRRHGVKAIFSAPATEEVREYAAILAKVADREVI